MRAHVASNGFLAAVLTLTACAPPPAAIEGDVGDDGKSDVWGTDSRKEPYQYPMGPLRDVAHATAAIVIGGGTLYVENGAWTGYVHSLGEVFDLCPGQRFAKQPSMSQCSGTLITSDILLTAGHCVEHEDCEDLQFVFDYAYTSAPTKPMSIVMGQPAENAYRCKKILTAVDDRDEAKRTGSDYALIRLDRPVTHRKPATVRWDASVGLGDKLFTIGYPSGLPQKITNGTVRNADPEYTFIEHDIDVFGGNSGGGVFDQAGRLVGLHSFSSGIRYVQAPDKECFVVAVCGENSACDTKPNAFSTRALAAALPVEVRAELGLR